MVCCTTVLTTNGNYSRGVHHPKVAQAEALALFRKATEKISHVTLQFVKRMVGRHAIWLGPAKTWEEILLPRMRIRHLSGSLAFSRKSSSLFSTIPHGLFSQIIPSQTLNMARTIETLMRLLHLLQHLAARLDSACRRAGPWIALARQSS